MFLSKSCIVSLKCCAFILVILLSLVSCTSSRYSLKHDIGPTGEFDASKVPDAIPIWEPLSPRGNKTPYHVRGKQYHLLNRSQEYSEEGIASWYGLKFHGELTSNGEIYNMYELSAAHKTLPLPSFVRVTNLDNNKSVIVRVNDRGPFHSGRIIDLSYAAAKKLGYAAKGTVNVAVELISLTPNDAIKLNPEEERLAAFIQLGAFSKLQAAEAMRDQANRLPDVKGVFVAQAPNREPALYRVRIGPFVDKKSAENLLGVLEGSGIGNPILISRAMNAKAH